LKGHGKPQHGTCTETNEVELLTLPVGGADVTSNLAHREFSLITVWGFPFEPSGAKIDANPLVKAASGPLSRAYGLVKRYDRAVEQLVGKALPFVHHLPSLARFGIEFGAGFLLGQGYLGVIKIGSSALKAFFAAAKFAPQLAAALTAGAEIAERTHQLKSLQEIISYVSGLADKGEYPVMGAVIRGRFLTSGYGKYGDPAKPSYVPLDSQLALSVKTTKFPTITVQVSRRAENNVDPNNPVTNGPLRWSGNSKPLDIFNKLSSNPAGVLTDAASFPYSIGLHGVHEVHANTAQTPALTKAVEDRAEEGTDFNAEAGEAALPDCSPFSNFPDTGTAICYKFNDGRP
jgi:hypothetical protein